MLTKTYFKELSSQIIGCAIEVHKHLGPGLLESVYHLCFIEELKRSGLYVKSQVYVPVVYKNTGLGGTLKLDILVNDEIIVELKAVDVMIPVYSAQLLSYLKLSNKHKGLLINFNSPTIREQLVSMVNDSYKYLLE